MGAEVRHLSARVVVIEAEIIEATVFVIGRFRRGTEPKFVIEAIRHWHRLPARTGTGLVVPPDIGDDALHVPDRAALHKLAGPAHEWIRTLMRAALQNALMLAHRLDHLLLPTDRQAQRL